jgi:small subunit ribosomal protein S16
VLLRQEYRYAVEARRRKGGSYFSTGKESKESVLAVKIRLARHGAKKAPYYRVIVADARARRDGRFIEEVGRYNPCVEPAMVQLDMGKVETWLANGAQPTATVERLITTAREQG